MKHALLALVVLVTPAAACPEGIQTIDTVAAAIGSVHAGVRCGDLVGETDAAGGGFSYGKISLLAKRQPPFDIELGVRRLTAGSGSVEIITPLGAVLLRDGNAGFYVSEAQFEDDGWKTVKGFRTVDEHHITVSVGAQRVSLSIDDRAILSWKATPEASVEPVVSVGFKGPPRRRARILVRDLRVVQSQAATSRPR